MMACEVNLTLLQKQPWLITPEAFDAIYGAVRSFFKDGVVEKTTPLPPLLSIEDGLGVISLHGPLLRNPHITDRLLFGAIDTDEVIAAVRAAAKNEDLQAIFLDIDSPGGAVNGTPELAATVAMAAKEKPIYAFSAGQMCSAAYWVASQCHAIYATPSARIGSIGVILPIIDSSGAFAQAGLKMEVFAAGKFKSAGVPGTSLTEDQRDWLQSEVEDIAADFRTAVLSRGRQIPDHAMEGQTFSGRRAMRLNLSGIIEGREEAMAKLRQLHVRSIDNTTKAMDTQQTIEKELADTKSQILRLTEDIQAREVTISEANERITALTANEVNLRSELSTLQAKHDQLTEALDTARRSLEILGEENTRLEAAEKDLEKRAALRAAQIIAESGNQAPAAITPLGDEKSDACLIEQFAAITDPTEQTAFWRSLSTQQKAAILSSSAK